MGSPTISLAKIQDAAQGNAALMELLQQLASTTAQQQAVTGTTPQSGANPGQRNPAAPVPSQAGGTVSLLGATYTVQIVNPGGSSPVSKLQAQQAAGDPNNAQSALYPVTAIYHQIRASTSPAFSVNSNTQTFGGTTGSAQTFWSLTGLGSGRWYFQFRSSYDGVNWNNWRNANGGAGLGGLVNQVTTETAGDAEWALFTAPGGLVIGVGAAELHDQDLFGIATGVYSSGMVAIAGPNGFPAQGNGVSGMTLSDVVIEVPTTGTAGVSGIPDFPVEMRVQMAQADTANLMPAYGSIFAIAFDPTNKNVALYSQPGGSTIWAVIRMPGGARVAFGMGKNLDQSNIWTPPGLTWMDVSRMMSVCSLTDTPLNQAPVTGFGQNALSGLMATGNYLMDTGGLGTPGIQSVNWMAIAWEVGANVQTVNGFPWLEIQLQGGHAMYIGAGAVASGTLVQLPAGCSSQNMLSICTPASSDNSGKHMRGIQQCAFIGDTPYLTYTDNTNVWFGNLNWMVAAWK